MTIIPNRKSANRDIGMMKDIKGKRICIRSAATRDTIPTCARNHSIQTEIEREGLTNKKITETVMQIMDKVKSPRSNGEYICELGG
jgi:hypothetical protein